MRNDNIYYPVQRTGLSTSNNNTHLFHVPNMAQCCEVCANSTERCGKKGGEENLKNAQN